MSLVVYGAVGSPFVRKVRTFLMEKGLAYDLEVTFPGQMSDEYKKIHPMAKIPALRDGDLTLPDSSAICAYLEKKYPERPLYPSDAYLYGRALWFEEYGDSAVAMGISGKIFFPKFIAPLFFQKPVDEAAIQKAWAETVPPLFDYLESQLQRTEFLVGDSFSIGDIGVGTHFFNLKLCGFSVDSNRWPKLAGYERRVMGRPSFSQLWGEESAVFKAS